MSLDIAYTNPYRPPSWRWQRAIEIYDRTGPMTTRRLDSPAGFQWIMRGLRFKRELEACRSDADKAVLANRRPDIFWAYYAFNSDSNPQKYSIEAHILARESDFDVGYRCGLSPRIVAAYEALFFNVRDKLAHTKYIVNCVFGSAVHRGLSEREYDLLWKLYGYFLGPHVLDALENKFVNPLWCGTADNVGSAIQDDTIATLKLKADLACKTVPVNGHTQLALIEQFTKFVEVERNTDSVGKSQAQILDHIEAMMLTLPFNVGGRVPGISGRMDRGPLNDFDQSAVELTYEETLRASVRLPIANADTLKALAFPVTRATQQITSEPQ